MPTKFKGLGVTFQYPENWTLDEEDMIAGRESVTVRSPSGGFWSVALDTGDCDPAELARVAVEAMKEEYEVELEEARETVGGRELIGYDLSFFYLDLINTASVRSFHTKGATFTVFYQAEDREFNQIGRVFEAMTVSLIQGVKGRG